MTRALLTLALVTFWGHTAVAQNMSIDDEVANVNGESITLGHVIQRFAVLPLEMQSQNDEVLWNGLIQMLITEALAAQSASEEDSKRVQFAIENARRSERAQEAIEEYVATAVPETAVRTLYEQRYQNSGDQEFNAAHILVADEAEAQALSDRAKQGTDFNTLARENSTGPSAPNGGELGWFSEGMMVPSFEAAVKELAVGEISGPVQSPFGWHVIKLNDARVSDAPPYEQARGALRAELENAAVDAFLTTQARDGAVTQIDASSADPSLVRMIDLLEE